MLKSHNVSALHTFMLVAQHPSFSSAAKALHLTTGAISQQLLQLEGQLGFSLFERHSRGVRLTEAGQTLHTVLQRSFQEIDSAIQSLSQRDNRKEIRLKLTPSLAFKWLVPRLDDFYRHNPDIQIQMFAEGALVDSDRRDFDLAIDYGPLPYPKPNAEMLMEESLLPVMSPSYLAAHPQLSHAAGWQDVVLLHDAMPWAKAPRDFEWLYWASEMGLELATQRGHFFNRTDMAMSAAEAGVGIAMARMALITNELDSGKLVTPFTPIAANAGYFLITHTANDTTRIFRDWLKAQIAVATEVE
ncbi:LysR family transcriptional regulator [Vibrio fluvialis]|uniref:LysR substrate-binding domain-containing protein n=1 Tax=Vibrio fluvialis TaxID=676 RepID=UPI00192AEDA7|nr:LysR substrate-binding domain-containing protein [Vibrio fluvialis]MBL4249579.1 LysR family transcriptional regulator [Vibrio fluvialis]MBL4258523.1 LysR family transcriptional regulator [Vibrio fluvialis]MBY7790445.1 LysR family transcriptional regulator [Vibrio fluvialis]